MSINNNNMISVIAHSNIKPASCLNNINYINDGINNKPRHKSASPLSILYPQSLEVVRENIEIEKESVS